MEVLLVWQTNCGLFWYEEFGYKVVSLFLVPYYT